MGEGEMDSLPPTPTPSYCLVSSHSGSIVKK
uniref:Uncharacterized protein n=1 Tax=Anguilla anguilla TaxID=7936 RepID=A0A0E9PSM5_ANGAN